MRRNEGVREGCKKEKRNEKEKKKKRKKIISLLKSVSFYTTTQLVLSSPDEQYYHDFEDLKCERVGVYRSSNENRFRLPLQKHIP